METPTPQAQLGKDAAIIIKNITREDGQQGIELGLVFTRKQDDQSEDTEAESFAKFAFNAVAKLYEQLTNPPDIVAPPTRPQQGAIRMAPTHPGQNFTPPTIMKGEESDLKR